MESSKIPEIVSQTINVISEKLKIPSDQLISVAINGKVIEGISDIVLSFLILVITIISVKFFYTLAKKQEEQLSDDVWAWAPMIIISIFGSISFLGILYGGILQTFAPGYSLLLTILGKN